MSVAKQRTEGPGKHPPKCVVPPRMDDANNACASNTEVCFHVIWGGSRMADMTLVANCYYPAGDFEQRSKVLC